MSEGLKEQKTKAQKDLELALAKEELFWKEKAKIRWHAQTNINTYYFYRVTKIKGARNKITSRKDSDRLITDETEMVAHAVNYYANIFGFAGTSQYNNLTDIIPTLVNDSMNSILTIIPSKEEIKGATFGLRKDSAPGPDGFGGNVF